MLLSSTSSLATGCEVKPSKRDWTGLPSDQFVPEKKLINVIIDVVADVAIVQCVFVSTVFVCIAAIDVLHFTCYYLIGCSFCNCSDQLESLGFYHYLDFDSFNLWICTLLLLLLLLLLQLLSRLLNPQKLNVFMDWCFFLFQLFYLLFLVLLILFLTWY